MAKDGKKAAIGLGVVAAAITGVILISRKAKAAPPPPPEPGLANLYGIVTDAESGQPISGVSVALDSHSDFTKNDGSYIFSNIAPGSYSITFEKSGYQALTR